MKALFVLYVVYVHFLLNIEKYIISQSCSSVVFYFFTFQRL